MPASDTKVGDNLRINSERLWDSLEEMAQIGPGVAGGNNRQTLTDADGKTYQVEIKPRGKYRRKVCEEPPLKVKFSKKALRAEGLDTLNEV